VVVKTNSLLGDIIRNKDANKRIVKWAMELCPYSLEFQSRTTIKSQALVKYWKMYFDSSLNIDGAGAGVLFISPNKDVPHYVLKLYFPTSNNTIEYEACLHGMQIAVELGIKRLYVFGDSALVIN
jgi:hypothetical protein